MPELTLTLPQYTLAQDQLAESERATKNEKGYVHAAHGHKLKPPGIQLQGTLIGL